MEGREQMASLRILVANACVMEAQTEIADARSVAPAGPMPFLDKSIDFSILLSLTPEAIAEVPSSPSLLSLSVSTVIEARTVRSLAIRMASVDARYSFEKLAVVAFVSMPQREIPLALAAESAAW